MSRCRRTTPSAPSSRRGHDRDLGRAPIGRRRSPGAGHRHPAPHRRQDVAPRAAGPFHDHACRRAGGSLRDRLQPVRAARPGALRASARAAHLPARSGLRPGHQRRRHRRPGHPHPRPGRAHRGPGPGGGRRPADGQGGDRHARGRPLRAWSSGWPSRAPWAAPSGPMPALTMRTSPLAWSRRRSSRPTGPRRSSSAAALGLGYRESALKTAPSAAPRVVTWGRFRLEPAEPALITERLDTIRRWRQAHQPLGQPSAGSVFRNPADGPSAGALIDGLGLKGLARGWRRRLREARQLHRQRPAGHGRRRAPPGRVGAGDRARADGRRPALRGRLRR